jgi:hypothetical protein
MLGSKGERQNIKVIILHMHVIVKNRALFPHRPFFYFLGEGGHQTSSILFPFFVSEYSYLPEQLLGPPLVGGESDDLPDQVPHELVVLGELALAAGGLGLQRVLGGLVTLLQTHADLISGRHCTSLL